MKVKIRTGSPRTFITGSRQSSFILCHNSHSHAPQEYAAHGAATF